MSNSDQHSLITYAETELYTALNTQQQNVQEWRHIASGLISKAASRSIDIEADPYQEIHPHLNIFPRWKSPHSPGLTAHQEVYCQLCLPDCEAIYCRMVRDLTLETWHLTTLPESTVSAFALDMIVIQENRDYWQRWPVADRPADFGSVLLRAKYKFEQIEAHRPWWERLFARKRDRPHFVAAYQNRD